jgi:DNA-binding NtrC family response regulator
LPSELTKHPKQDGFPSIPGATMLELERYAILKTLEALNGSITKTAATLGVSVRKLQYRLQEYRNPSESGTFERLSGVPRRVAFRSAR